MYKCSRCGKSSRIGQSQIKHVVETREVNPRGTQIVKEAALCYSCAGVPEVVLHSEASIDASPTEIEDSPFSPEDLAGRLDDCAKEAEVTGVSNRGD